MKIKIDEKYNYIVERHDGEQFILEFMPKLNNDKWVIRKGYWRNLLDVKFDLGNDWRNSLHQIVRQGEHISFNPIIQRVDLQIDTKIIVYDEITNTVKHRYFAAYPDDPSVPGIYVFLNGKTSWSSDENYKAYYRKWEICP